MPAVYPDQIRSVDPYADHRFSNTINRFNRILTQGENVILPYDGYEFELTKMTTSGSSSIAGVTYTWSAGTSVKIGPGLCIKDDTLIHIKNIAYINFDDQDNYVGSGANYNQFNSEGKYFILLKYSYSRSIPAPVASYVIAKSTQRAEFLQNRDKYLYLGTANVMNDGSNYVISSIDLEDEDELNSNALIERSKYKFYLEEVDAGPIGNTT